ncbi:MAG: hypothetical protein HYZ92_05135 [Candidatus Omnitrophica bacterium]|nr:hypothetical protein [Candidatus Omnitrophota bacterium]
MNQSTKRLGDLLIERGWLASWQLEAALAAQRSSKEFLGRILLQKGWLTEERLLEVLAEQFSIERVRLVDEPVDWSLAITFPVALLRGHHCLPIRKDDKTLLVAVANPLDVWVLSELERLAQRRVELVLASEREIREAIQRVEQHGLHSLDQQLRKGRNDGV